MTGYQETPDQLAAKAEILLLQSQLSQLHLEGPEVKDWKKIRDQKAPIKPELKADAEMAFRVKHARYFQDVSNDPSGVRGIRKSLLKTGIMYAISQDRRIYKQAIKDYMQEYRDWKSKHDVAEEMCTAHPDFYADIIKEMGGDFYDGLIPVSLDIEAIVRVLEDGERKLIFCVDLSINEEKAGNNIDAYFGLESVLALRTARNLFALFPTDIVFFNYFDRQIDRKTGHEKQVCALSLAFTRELFLSLNLEKLDPDESMENFEHTINEDQPLDFEKTLAIVLE